MRRVFISYIVPCYNVQAYLQRSLDSLFSQSIEDGSAIEFILVNDGSTDDTLSLLKKFAEKDKRAIVIDQQNKGVSAARNAGLRVARGEYVFFLDGDDYLTDDATQIIYDVCKSNEPDIVVANAFIVREGIWDAKKEWNTCFGIEPGLFKTLDFASLVKSLPISFKVYRRELLENNTIFYNEDLRVGEVYTFFIHAMTCSNHIAFSNKRIMNYLVRKSGVMRTVNVERDRLIIKAIHYVDEYVRNKMPELLDYSSYKLGLYNIVNLFSIFNYVKKSPYTREIGNLLKAIGKDRIYKEIQIYYICKNFGKNKIVFSSLLLYFLPVSFIYRLLRIRNRIKDVMK